MTDFQYFQSILFTDKRTLEYVTDKSKSASSIINYMLSRLQKMFKYSNLPDTIPRQYLENYLLVNGHCIIAPKKENGSIVDPSQLYSFIGAAGGEPDIYYRPTKYMVANPSLNFSAEYYISTTDPNHEPDAVLIRNDTMWQGLYPMMARYSSLISENLLTLRVADVMLRVLALITAPDDKSKQAADEYLKNIAEGKLASIAENRFLDGIRMQNPPSNNGSYLTQFIELHQYLIGSFYNEVGLNANYNMKREALSESETGLNDDSLMPLCEDMLRCRREDMTRVNELFGTSITVDFDSSWLENIIERTISIRRQASEASSQLDNPAPLEEGMENVGLEGASMEGAANQGDGSLEETGDDNGSPEDDGMKDGGIEDENNGRDDSESTNESNAKGDDNSNEDDSDKDGVQEGENEQGTSEENGDEGSGNKISKGFRIKVDTDISIEDAMNPPEEENGAMDEEKDDGGSRDADDNRKEDGEEEDNE